MAMGVFQINGDVVDLVEKLVLLPATLNYGTFSDQAALNLTQDQDHPQPARSWSSQRSPNSVGLKQRSRLGK